MVAGFLYLNAVLYAVLALWCTVKPWATSSSMGYARLDPGGKSEYLVVYGGLQLGLAVVFAYCAWAGELRVGLLLALALYVPIVAYRLVTVARFRPVGATTRWVAGLELALLVASVALWLVEPGARP